MKKGFEFLILEHRPHDSQDCPKSRTLTGTMLTKDGLTVLGSPRYDTFKATISMPHNGSNSDVTMKVVSIDKKSFKTEFVSPSKKFKQNLAWWFEDQPYHAPDLGISV